MRKHKSLLLILSASILGGGIAPLSKFALAEIPTGLFNLLRFLIAAAVLLPVFFYRPTKLEIKDIKNLFLISMLATANTTLFIFGLKFTTAGNSQVLYAGVPLIVAVIARFFIGERLNFKKTLGLILGFAGLIAVILSPILGNISFSRQNLLGNLLILLGVISFAIYSVLCKKIEHKYSPLILTLAFVVTTIVVQTLLLTTLRDERLATHISNGSLLSLFYVGIFGMALYYIIYQQAIKISTPTVASAVLYLQPIFAVIISAWLLGEKLTIPLVLGGLIVFIGVAFLTNAET